MLSYPYRGTEDVDDMLVVWTVVKLLSSIPKVKSGFAQLPQSERFLREAFRLCFPVHTVNRMELDFVSALHFDCGHRLSGFQVHYEAVCFLFWYSSPFYSFLLCRLTHSLKLCIHLFYSLDKEKYTTLQLTEACFTRPFVSRISFLAHADCIQRYRSLIVCGAL